MNSQNQKIRIALGIALSLAILGGAFYGLQHRHNQKRNESASTPSETAAKHRTSAVSTRSSTGAPSVAGANTSAKTGAEIPATDAAAAKKKAQADELAHSCFTEVFTHKHLASHEDGEACLHHRNLLHIAHAVSDPKRVCVRVNGTPVHFQVAKGHHDEFIIGPIAGPHAKISVHYCMAKARCNEDCTVPKDDFMAAIGGEMGQGALPDAKWDPSDDDADGGSLVDPEIRRELANATDLKIFSGWISGGESLSCGGKSPRG